MKISLLKDICNIEMGQSPKGSSYNEEKIGLPLLGGASDLGEIYPRAKKFTTEPNKITQKDDLILCIRATIGDRNWADKEYCLGRGVAGLRPKKDLLDSRYLWHWLEVGKEQLLKQANGSTFKQVTRDAIGSCNIPLPPIAEQRRIAAILDKADGIRRKRQEAIRLTEELGRSLFLDMFGDPVSNPKGWETVEIDQLVNKIDSGWSPKCDSRVANKDEWAVLKLGAITWGFFNENENKALLPDVQPKLELEVKSGDLLFARKNTYELVGATAYVKRTREKLLLPDLIFRLKTNEKVNSVFLWKLLSQESMRKEISLLASGSSGSMPNISKARLRQLKVISPPLEMQEKFNSIFEKYWIFQESSEKFQQESENLFNSLLQRAFRGEL